MNYGKNILDLKEKILEYAKQLSIASDVRKDIDSIVKKYNDRINNLSSNKLSSDNEYTIYDEYYHKLSDYAVKMENNVKVYNKYLDLLNIITLVLTSDNVKEKDLDSLLSVIDNNALLEKLLAFKIISKRLNASTGFDTFLNTQRDLVQFNMHRIKNEIKRSILNLDSSDSIEEIDVFESFNKGFELLRSKYVSNPDILTYDGISLLEQGFSDAEISYIQSLKTSINEQAYQFGLKYHKMVFKNPKLLDQVKNVIHLECDKTSYKEQCEFYENILKQVTNFCLIMDDINTKISYTGPEIDSYVCNFDDRDFKYMDRDLTADYLDAEKYRVGSMKKVCYKEFGDTVYDDITKVFDFTDFSDYTKGQCTDYNESFRTYQFRPCFKIDLNKRVNGLKEVPNTANEARMFEFGEYPQEALSDYYLQFVDPKYKTGKAVKVAKEFADVHSKNIIYPGEELYGRKEYRDLRDVEVLYHGDGGDFVQRPELLHGTRYFFGPKSSEIKKKKIMEDCPIYEVDGVRFIVFKNKCFRVSPIKWFYDDATKMLVCSKVLCTTKFLELLERDPREYLFDDIKTMDMITFSHPVLNNIMKELNDLFAQYPVSIDLKNKIYEEIDLMSKDISDIHMGDDLSKYNVSNEMKLDKYISKLEFLKNGILIYYKSIENIDKMLDIINGRDKNNYLYIIYEQMVSVFKKHLGAAYLSDDLYKMIKEFEKKLSNRKESFCDYDFFNPKNDLITLESLEEEYSFELMKFLKELNRVVSPNASIEESFKDDLNDSKKDLALSCSEISYNTIYDLLSKPLTDKEVDIVMEQKVLLDELQQEKNGDVIFNKIYDIKTALAKISADVEYRTKFENHNSFLVTEEKEDDPKFIQFLDDTYKMIDRLSLEDVDKKYIDRLMIIRKMLDGIKINSSSSFNKYKALMNITGQLENISGSLKHDLIPSYEKDLKVV